MQIPIEISYRNIAKNSDLDGLIRERAEKLTRVCGSLVSCRVAVEKPQEQQDSGNPYRVRIDVRVPPGNELVVRKEPGQEKTQTDVRAVVNDAFDAMSRRLRDLNDRRQDRAKKPPSRKA
ncbi:MAG: ribosome-associated translation inhibitor RaiA [Candidatus Eisenbacteria bacterium]|nr:ribosome-associated translation inhibitor RaiA [Candidatus Eisenbacteria bacterium]